ncbi:1477_t:CDS:2 [Dentiscutata erythropus]|uniref:1477_t:CDS:1 n=1 Tax=Dentiscutata erythropus TaxID=1348616 RepID=A0A9N8VIG3_9GLOM|nr:1477_t:CDS:2 [Dentiscutata erythropus]
MADNEEMLKRKYSDLTGHDIRQENQKNLKRNCSSNEQYLSSSFDVDGLEESFGLDNFNNFDFDKEDTDNLDDLTSNKEDQDQETQQPAPPQRKKPGRKPNPASPALRKEQNRAAQRAFRERKERHLKDLENTIKSLRESQYESAVKTYRESQQLRSLIERLRSENLYWKQVSVNFEMVLNHFCGGTETTAKIKSTILSRIQSLSPSLTTTSMVPLLENQVSTPAEMGRPLQSFQSMNNNNLCGVTSFLSPPNSTITLSPGSSVTKSPPTSPVSSLNDNFIQNFEPTIIPNATTTIPNIPNTHENSFIDGSELSILPKSNDVLINNDSFSTTSDLVAQNSDSLTDCIFNENIDLFSSSNVGGTKDIYSDFNLNNIVLTKSEISSDLFKELDQAVRLGKLVGITDIYNTPVNPKLKYPLTNSQIYYLSLPHDRRIDLIPCLHLRSRMIQYQDNFDLYDLIELLITKSICHGDPLDPDSWQLPEEFFANYDYLVFSHCRLKSSLYQTYGRLPTNFSETYQSMLPKKKKNVF